MKNLKFMVAAFLCSAAIFAVSPAETSADEASGKASSSINWSLLWSGSWEENKTLYNRGELRLHFLQSGLVLRAQALDRRTLNFALDPPWGDPQKAITHFMGGLYHRPTGSRLLFGVLDEWGLPARIRNPWIRSAPYTENHRSIMADLRTAVSSTRKDELYLYLSSPFMKLFPDVRLRSFASAQTQIENFTESGNSGIFMPALSGGLDFIFAGKTNLLLEGFYTGRTLPQTRSSTWFSDPPRLPEREFHLYAAAFLISNPAFSVSSDFALSETFVWGKDIYSNLAVTVTPLISAGRRARPLTVSLAADGAGERFVNRDGANVREGFRCAARIEWRGMYNSMLSFNSVLRSGGLGERFNRSSAGFYWRFPSQTRNPFPIRLTRISLSADRNAENPLKINDNFSWSAGFNINLRQANNSNPLRLTLSGSIKGAAISEGIPFFYPIPDSAWNWNSVSSNCEIFWSPLNFQFRARVGVSFFAEKEEIWDFSLSTAIRFKHGRLNLRAESPDFPKKWNWTVSWRLEIKSNK